MYCQHCMSKISDAAAVCEHCHHTPTVKAAPHRLAAGTMLNGRYLIGDAIGEGGFGITYIGLDVNLEMKVAVKEFYPHGYANRNNGVTNDVTLVTTKELSYFDNAKERFLTEAKSIAKFSDEPAIVDVRDYFTENNTAYIVMEYIDGMTLAAHIKQYGVFSADELFRRMEPLMKALERMHRENVIHRDISPDNIMYLKSGSLKLMDFGSARYFTNDQKEMSVLLKQGYAPEEQYRKNGDQGPWTDVYGLCATMYRCITGTIPVDALDRMRNDTLAPPSQMGVDIPESMEVVLMYGLAVFKENRCQSMDELADLMEKALAKQQITVKNSQDVYADINRTQAADAFYRQQTQKQFTGSDPTQLRQSYIPPQNRKTDQPAPRNQTNKKAVTAIIVISAVIIIAAVTLMIFLLLPKDDKPTPKPTDSSSSAIISGASSITMPNCVNMSLEYSKTNLENAGLIVETEYEYSDDVTKDSVIKQSIDADSQVEPGSTVTLTVSKGAETSPYDYDQKLTVSASSGSSSATATLYEWKNGDWSEIASYDATVGANGIGVNREGQKTSPEGTHKLGVVLTKGDVSTNMNTYNATPETGVVSDANSSYYNQIFEKSNAPTLNKFDIIYEEFSNAAIFIEFNGDGFSSDGVDSGAGSAIFLRGKSGSLSSTYGDVDISASDMSDLLTRLDPNKKPVIELVAN